MQYRADFKTVPARLIAVSDVYKVVCAWCKGIIRDAESEIISHGICKLCSDSLLNCKGEKSGRYAPAITLEEIASRIRDRFRLQTN